MNIEKRETVPSPSKAPRVLGIFFLTASLLIIPIIPYFESVYKELLEGARLPVLTNFIIYSNPYFWIIFGYIPGIFLIFYDKGLKDCYDIYIFIVLSVLIVITFLGLFYPLINIIDRMPSPT